jgi:hypothetical protein
LENVELLGKHATNKRPEECDMSTQGPHAVQLK